MSIRVLLADDHEIMLNGLRSLLEQEADMVVVGEAKDGREAVAAAREKAPQVVVMDLSMPGMNGIEATRRIAAEQPAVKVLCFSMHGDQGFVGAALEAGAAGYLLKDYAVDDLVQAIRAVAAGETYLCPQIAGTVVEAYKAARGKNTGPSAYSLLTAREREVLQLIAEGHTNGRIAERLGLSVKTVGTHRERLMAKLDIHTVAGLTKYAVREGLTSS